MRDGEVERLERELAEARARMDAPLKKRRTKRAEEAFAVAHDHRVHRRGRRQARAAERRGARRASALRARALRLRRLLVEKSRWLQKLIAINRVHERFDPRSWQEKRHFLLVFHDETVEAVARSIEVRPVRTSMRALLNQAIEALWRETLTHGGRPQRSNCRSPPLVRRGRRRGRAGRPVRSSQSSPTSTAS
jgi:hypothetical protein